MADLNEILYGQTGNPQIGVPQVPPGVLQQAPVAPIAPPAQVMPGGNFQQAAPLPSPPPQVPQSADNSGGFSSLVEKVQSDPALSQAAMMAGIRLAQGARPGQSVLGLVGDATQMGMTAFQMMQGNKRDQPIETRAAEAKVQGQELSNLEQAQAMPLRMKSLLEKTKALERAGKVDEVEALIKLMKAEFQKAVIMGNGDQIEKVWYQELMDPSVSNSLRQELLGAQILHQQKAADAQGALADQRRAETANPEKYRTVGQPTAEAEKWRLRRESVQLRYPDASPPEVERIAAEELSTAKSMDVVQRRNAWLANQYPSSDAEVAKYREMAVKLFPDEPRGPARRSVSGQIGTGAPVTSSRPTVSIAAIRKKYPERTMEEIRAIADSRNLQLVD